MKLKSVLSMMLVLIMMTSMVLSGCATQEETTEATGATETGETTENTGEGDEAVAEELEPITYTMFIGESHSNLAPDNKILKMIEEEFGITFEIEYLVGDLNQKMGVMMASGEYPDLIVTDRISELRAEGALLDMTEYISDEKTPNIMSHFSDIDFIKMSDPDTGEISVLPNRGVVKNEHVETSHVGSAFWIQKAVLQEFDYPEIESLEQYFDIIAQYKEKYPEIDGTSTVGFQVLNYDWRAYVLMCAPEYLMGYPNDGAVVVDKETGVAQTFMLMDGAKEYYKTLNKAYHDGLIPAETFVMNYDEYIATVSTGAVLGVYDDGWQVEPAVNALIDQKRFERTYVPLGITYEGIEPHYRDYPTLNVDYGFAITRDCEEPERFVQFMEAMVSEEWQKILSWGIEGEDYNVDENGMFYMTDEQIDNRQNIEWGLANRIHVIYDNLPRIQGKFNDGNCADPMTQPSVYQGSLKPIDLEFLEAYGVDNFVDMLGPAKMNVPEYPAWQIDISKDPTVYALDQQVQELQRNYLPQIIIGELDEFEQNWADYAARYDEVDMDYLNDFYNRELELRRERFK